MKKNELLQKISEKLNVPIEEVESVMRVMTEQLYGEHPETKFPFTQEELNQLQDETMIDAVPLVVRCRRNDGEDVRVGGPPYLGYVFLVEKEKKEAIKALVLQQMKQQNQSISPLTGSMFYGEERSVMVKELWNKTMIARAIDKGCE